MNVQTGVENRLIFPLTAFNAPLGTMLRFLRVFTPRSVKTSRSFAMLTVMDVKTKSELEQRIKAHGYELIYQDWCECADTPGFLGQIRGVTDHNRKLVRISLNANPTPELMEDILRHELRHLDEPDWDCGNRDIFGRGGRQ